MPGTVLLLAASPLGRGRLVDAASVLPVLAAVEPSVLSGTETATVVELADPLEPQAVLTRLRAAAAAPGPLTVFVTGQLQLDRRQRLPHLALARTTPATVRYTALPWHWLREELRLRPDGTTALVADLYADPDSWRQLYERPLDAGRNIAVFGRIAPPAARRTVAVPSYMKAVATILRSGHRPPLERLHEQALTRLAQEPGGGGGPGIVLAARRPAVNGPQAAAVTAVTGSYAWASTAVTSSQAAAVTAVTSSQAAAVRAVTGPHTSAATATARSTTATDPHAAIAACVESGRHGDADLLAARWEQAAVRAYGAASEDALHWTEVRADLAMFAGDAARSCRAWLTVAATRLAMGQGAGAPAVEAAVDRAHHQWGQIGDPERARELGPVLAELRGRVPGRRQGALDHVRRQLRQLQTQG